MINDCEPWDRFYYLHPDVAEREPGRKLMLDFFIGKVSISKLLIVDQQPICDYCTTEQANAIEVRIPCDTRYVCWSPGCLRRLIEDFNIGILDMCPMRARKYVDRQKERAKITNSVRWRVIKRDNFRCVACGSSDNLVVDHKHPICKGGTSDMSNLQTLCFVCNSGKGGS